MMGKMFSYGIFWLLILCIGSTSAAAMEVNSIRFGDAPERTRVVFDLTGPADFDVDPQVDHVVVHIANASAFHDSPRGRGRGLVTAYRTDQQGSLRVTLETQGASVKRAFTIAAHDGRPDRLVIDFVPRSEGTSRTVAAPALATQATAPALAVAAPLPAPKPRDRKRIIVLDPGHGGVDPGAISRDGRFEKDLALTFARELRDALKKTGRYTVYMTRDKDIYIPLRRRIEIARGYAADLFISVHADSLRSGVARGASVYTLSETASDAETAKLAARENRSDIIAGVDLAGEEGDVAGILIDLAMRDSMNQSRHYARSLVDSLGHYNVRLLTKPHRSAGFAVLKSPDVPSVLLEMGFLSNAEESRILHTRVYRARLARAIIESIDVHFARQLLVNRS